ncbi:hypothetical protein BGZ72_001113 [Mortierella alpina]|nr:hypothetical protein BGZ72_001113 [Mortierella alpina]
MSKDVRRLFAAQKAAKAAASPVSAGSGTPSLASTTKRVTHPLAKYDPKTLRLTCAICGPAINIRSDSLWNAHLVSKAHQEAVAKLRAVKEQMQRREAEAAERQRLQQLQQSQQQGVKRKATGGLVAYAEESESDDDDDNDNSSEKSHLNKNTLAVSDSKRVKIDGEAEIEHDRNQVEQDIEDEEDAMAGLPAGFFDATDATSTSSADPVPQSNGIQVAEQEEEPMEGVLPSGFFDDPEQDARIRAEVGGATTDLQQRQVDAEFKALQADLARDFERQEQQEAAVRSGQVPQTHTSAAHGSQATSEHIPYEEKVELEEQEVEESILARSEEEYLLFVEMQERLEALREKKERLVAPRSSAAASSSSTPSAIQPVPSISTTTTTATKPRKQKSKSILELVREQEKAKRDKERLAAEAFARLSTADVGDRKMASDGEDSEEDDEDDEDIEAMMDWRARRV